MLGRKIASVIILGLIVASGKSLAREQETTPKPAQEEILSDGPPHATMAAPQQKNNNEQSRASLISAPGTDQTRFVPGSTVASFSQFEYFKIGKLLFRPSGVISYGYDSNLYAQYEGAESNHTLSVAPTIETLLPIGANGIRVDYSARYNHYSNFQPESPWDHSLNADSQIDFSPIMNIAIRDHFAVSSTDSREFLPSREVIFSSSKFRRNSVEGTFNWALTESGNLGLNASWNSVKFLEAVENGNQPFYSYDDYNYGGFYRRSVSQRTSFFADGMYYRTATEDPRQLTDSNGYEAVGGFESQLTPLISGQFSIGARRENYIYATSQTHTGLVYRGSMAKEITESSRVSIAFSRANSLSNYQHNAYFLAQGVGLTYLNEFGTRLMISVSPGYQRNDYPELLEEDPSVPHDLVGKEKRHDSMFDIGGNARYRFKPWIALDFRFDYLRRKSNIPEYNFSSYRAGVSLLLGNSGIRMGRIPY